jgi:ubiquinone/menaquinone biosynthesis C-methylase UbiE
MVNEFVDAKTVVREIKAAPGLTVADFGSGSGFLSLELAKTLGPTGLVYAIDILEEPLEVLKKTARDRGIINIRAERGDLEQPNGSKLDDGSCHWVVLSNLLFQVEQPVAVVMEAARVLKPHGNLLVIDWHPDKIVAAEGHSTISRDDAKKLCEEHGFSFQREFAASARQFGMVFQKIS